MTLDAQALALIVFLFIIDYTFQHACLAHSHESFYIYTHTHTIRQDTDRVLCEFSSVIFVSAYYPPTPLQWRGCYGAMTGWPPRDAGWGDGRGVLIGLFWMKVLTYVHLAKAGKRGHYYAHYSVQTKRHTITVNISIPQPAEETTLATHLKPLHLIFLFLKNGSNDA